MITKSITACGVNIDIWPGPAAISLSGGADSAILLYILLKNGISNLDVWTLASKEKNFASPRAAYNVLCRCMELTGNYNCTHNVFFTPRQTLETLIVPLSTVASERKYTKFYTGATSLPPDDQLATFRNETPLYDRRNPNVERQTYSGKFYIPFYNVDKKRIAELYHHYGLMDTLYPLTRSCESHILTEGHCGVCWWCEERQWAFGKLN